MTKSKLDLPKTRGGQVISLDLFERTIFNAIKKSGEQGLPAGKARDLLGHTFSETTFLRICERLCDYGLAGKSRAPGGSVVYRIIRRRPGRKAKPRIGELRAYQSTLHPRLRVRNDAKFVDGIFETDDLAVQQLLESLSDFNVHIFRVTLEEAQTARIAARAERDRVAESQVVRS